MPHVGTAMERSLEDGGLVDGLNSLVARSMVAAAGKRSTFDGITNSVTGAKTALSSWDNCMAATFCKWPVIGVIIVGSLIVLSILWCCARCLFCGVSCCCECCYCLKCCGNCCGMCDPPGGRKHKYLDEPFVPQHHGHAAAYRPQAPMGYPTQTYAPQPPPPQKEVPQYATFESEKKDADSLPAMPTWNDGTSQKVLLDDDVEMEPLKKPTPAQPQNVSLPSPISGMSPRLGSGASPTPSVSPYGPPQGVGGPNGYMGVAAGSQAQQQGAGYPPSNGYGQQPAQYSLGQGKEYGVGQGQGAAASMAAGQQPYYQQDQNASRHQIQPQGLGINGQHSQAHGFQGFPQSQTPQPYADEYGRSMTPNSYGRNGTPGSSMRPNGYGPSPPPIYGFENQARTQSPAPQPGAGYRSSPRPENADGFGQQGFVPNGHGRMSPQRQYTGASQNQYSAGSSQHYGESRQQQQYPPVNPQGSGYAAGHQQGYNDRSQDYAGPTQQPAELSTNTGAGYPGYRAYKPQGGY